MARKQLLDTDDVGAPGGVAPLNSAGDIPEANLPDRLNQAGIAATILAQLGNVADPSQVSILLTQRAQQLYDQAAGLLAASGPGILYDTDGVPYFSPIASTDDFAVYTDTDGRPYFDVGVGGQLLSQDTDAIPFIVSIGV